jgi:inorganic pyrophosphatase
MQNPFRYFRIALEQIQHFFEHYKDLEPGKWVKIIGWGDVAEAKQLIRDAIRRERDDHADLPL